MNVDQEDEHSWLRREDEFVRGLLERARADARRLPRRAAAREGGGSARRPVAGAGVRVHARRALGRRRGRSAVRRAAARVRRLERARLRLPRPGGRRRARALAGLRAGVQARRQRVGRAVPSGDPGRPGGALAERGPRAERERARSRSCAGATTSGARSAPGCCGRSSRPLRRRLLAAAEPPVDESSRFCHRQRGPPACPGSDPGRVRRSHVSRGRSSRRDHSCHDPT